MGFGALRRIQAFPSARAARHGRRTEAEIQAIREEAISPPVRVRLGSVLAEVCRRALRLCVVRNRGCPAHRSVRREVVMWEGGDVEAWWS